MSWDIFSFHYLRHYHISFIWFYIFFKLVLYFIKNMIYFNKLIDICINRYESQKVVNNYFVGTIKTIDIESIFYWLSIMVVNFRSRIAAMRTNLFRNRMFSKYFYLISKFLILFIFNSF